MKTSQKGPQLLLTALTDIAGEGFAPCRKIAPTRPPCQPTTRQCQDPFKFAALLRKSAVTFAVGLIPLFRTSEYSFLQTVKGGGAVSHLQDDLPLATD